MSTSFIDSYRKYVDSLDGAGEEFGFDLKAVEEVEPFLNFLYHIWWRVDLAGLDHLPETGPALIVGNAGGGLPWQMIMLMYALMESKTRPRRLNIMADLDWIDDERIHRFLLELGFVPWSSGHAKRLFSSGELVAICPEGNAGFTKPFSERYRLKEFDWTKLLPAVEAEVPIFPLATVGCDEAVPVLGNLKILAGFLGMPAYPVTPFFPWLPCPVSIFSSLPVKWHMRIMKSHAQELDGEALDARDRARRLSRLVEGGVQAEVNRLLRQRIKSL